MILTTNFLLQVGSVPDSIYSSKARVGINHVIWKNFQSASRDFYKIENHAASKNNFEKPCRSNF